MMTTKSLSKQIALLAISACVLAPEIAAATNYQSCAPRRVLAPSKSIQTPPRNAFGCTKGAVIRLPDRSSVWRCTVGTGANLASANVVLLVSSNGTMKRLPDATPNEGVFQFSVWLRDLNNDGQDERILSYWNGISADGLSNSWTALVFRQNWQSLTPEGEDETRNMAGASDIHDWGLKNLIKDPADPNNCLLALSEFKRQDGVEGLRVDFHRLGRASLIPASSAPSVFRPLDDALKVEREADYRLSPYSGNVLHWISSLSAKTLAVVEEDAP
jgi:hypothetical protein